MRALVLAAGLGERLKPLTEQSPKPMLPLGGRPLIEYPLRMLGRAGLREVAVNIHHLGEQLRANLGGGERLGLRITYAPEPKLLGTGGPLVGLREYLGSDSFMLLNSDTVLDLDVAGLVRLHRLKGGLATLVVRRPENARLYSRLYTDRALRIGRIEFATACAAKEAGASATAPGFDGERPRRAWMYCGVAVCEPEVLQLDFPAVPFRLIRDLLAPALAAGRPLFGYPYRGYFATADDLAGYQRLCREFAAQPPALSYLA